MKRITNNKRHFALITGASEGMGKAFAEYLAKRGKNLALVALPDENLDYVKEYLKIKYNVKVYSLGIDLTSENACQKVINWLNNHEISINMLINNAGMGNSGDFETISSDIYLKQIKLNIVSVTVLTRQLIEQLKDNRPSYILNVGSIAGFFIMPFKSVYSASKSFVISLSLSLREELASTGIYVSVLCPGGVVTNDRILQMKRQQSWLGRMSMMKPETVARVAIEGLYRKKRIMIPGHINRLLFLMNYVLPPKVRARIAISKYKNRITTLEQNKDTPSLEGILAGIGK